MGLREKHLLEVRHKFSFLQIPGFLISAILYMFYFLKINLVPNKNKNKNSKKGKDRLPCYCYILVTGDTAGAQAMPQTCKSLGDIDAPVWLSQACNLLTSIKHN